MNWSAALEVANVVALSIGVLFGGYQLVELRRQRRRDSVFGLVRSYQSADFTAARGRVNELPDGADSATIDDVLGPDGRDQVFLVGLTWESLGALAFRREIEMATVDDFFRGAIAISWRKLNAFVVEDRERLQRDTVWEWFQWLAEQMNERERQAVPVPAHIKYRNWPKHRGWLSEGNSGLPRRHSVAVEQGTEHRADTDERQNPVVETELKGNTPAQPRG